MSDRIEAIRKRQQSTRLCICENYYRAPRVVAIMEWSILSPSREMEFLRNVRTRTLFVCPSDAFIRGQRMYGMSIICDTLARLH
jgi:hypothetical protein